MRQRLLIIDHDVRAARELARQMGLRGWEVTTAGNTRRAFDQIKSVPPTAVLINLDMCELNPLDMIRYLRHAHHEGPLQILITGKHVRGTRLLEAWEAGADGYVASPWKVDSIEDLLRGGCGKPGGFRLKDFARRAGRNTSTALAG